MPCYKTLEAGQLIDPQTYHDAAAAAMPAGRHSVGQQRLYRPSSGKARFMALQLYHVGADYS